MKVPARVRRLLRRLLVAQAPLLARVWQTEPRVVGFVAGVFRRHWRTAALGLLAVGLSAVFEGGTIGILYLALAALANGSAAVTASLGSFGHYIEPMIARSGPEALFLMLLGLAVVAQLLKSAMQFAGDAMTAHLRARLQGDVRDRVFRQFMEMSYAEVSSYRIGNLSSYADQARYIELFVRELNTLASKSGLVLSYLVVLILVSWSMTLLTVMVLGGLALLLGRTIRRIRAAAKEYTLASVALNERTLEYLEGQRTVRAFGRTAHVLERVRDALRESIQAQRKGLILKAMISPVVQSLTIITVAGGLGVALLVFGEGGVRDILPRLAVFVLVLNRLMPQFGNINNSVARINDFMPPIERLAEILRTDDKEYLPSGTRPFEELREGVEFRNVGLTYRATKRHAVAGVSFDLPRGRMVALVGASGAGKSTLADLLLRFYDPSEGAILVDGVNLRELDTTAWRKRLGIVSQDTFIFNASVRDNIAFGKLDATDDEIMAAARAAQAHEFIERLSDGYATEIGDRGYRLSGGQRQRLAIARALLRDPDILILDEATSDLDSHSEALIQEALVRLRSERTVLAIAHRLSTVAMADEILVLSNGALAERGTHDELLARDGLYAHLWKLQAGTDGRAEAAAAASSRL